MSADRSAAASVLIARPPNADEQSRKQRWRSILEADRMRMLLSMPFTASLAMYLELLPICDSRLRTAGTDGRHIYFSIDFLDALDDETRLFVFAHEVGHSLCGHLRRIGDRDPLRWNIAIDHEINAILVRDGLRLPADAVYFPSFDGQSAEVVYTAFTASARMVQFDRHQLPDQFSKELSDSVNAVIDPEFQPVIPDDALEQRWTERIVAAANQLRGRGSLDPVLAAWIETRVHPVLPWQQVLRRFVQRSHGGSRRWIPPSRRHLHRQLWLPGIRGEMLRAMVAIDTSGSTTDDWPRFLAEVRQILCEFPSVELTLVECDLRIQRVRRFTGPDIRQLNADGIRGGGGTDLRPPFELAATDPPSCLIYLTDGEGAYPSLAPDFPVLWAMSTDTAMDWGTILRLDRQ